MSSQESLSRVAQEAQVLATLTVNCCLHPGDTTPACQFIDLSFRVGILTKPLWVNCLGSCSAYGTHDDNVTAREPLPVAMQNGHPKTSDPDFDNNCPSAESLSLGGSQQARSIMILSMPCWSAGSCLRTLSGTFYPGRSRSMPQVPL